MKRISLRRAVSLALVGIGVCFAAFSSANAQPAAPQSQASSVRQVGLAELGLGGSIVRHPGEVVYVLQGAPYRVVGFLSVIGPESSGKRIQAATDLQLQLVSPDGVAKLVEFGNARDLEVDTSRLLPGQRLSLQLNASSALRQQRASAKVLVQVLPTTISTVSVPRSGLDVDAGEHRIRFSPHQAQGAVRATLRWARLPGADGELLRIDYPLKGTRRFVPYRSVAREECAADAQQAQPSLASLLEELNSNVPYATNPDVLTNRWSICSADYIGRGERRLPPTVTGRRVQSGELNSLVSTGWPKAQWATMTPVLLVHGYAAHDGTGIVNVRFPYLSGGQSYWGNLPNLVRLYAPVDGQRYVPFEYRWNTDTQFTLQGAELAEAINAIYAETGRSVVIAAHSFGGLLVRTVLQDLAGAAGTEARTHVAGVMTVGTPHSGIADSASTHYGVDLPRGQDPGIDVFELCGQVSCHVGGEPVDDLSDSELALLNLQREAGVDVAALFTSRAQLPAIRLAQGVGVDQDVGPDFMTYYYQDGDGLITLEGQRLFPDERTTAFRQWSTLAGSSVQVKEQILGHVAKAVKAKAHSAVADGRIFAGDPWARAYFHSSLNRWPEFEPGAGMEAYIPAKKGCDQPATCQHATWRLLMEVLPSGSKLNDTGQTICIDPNDLSSSPPAISCAGSAQDGEFGRDVASSDPTDGRVGFSYVKISDTGAELPADATSWTCVKDKVSGLIWEEKTNDGGLRDKDNTYTNWGDGRGGDSSAFLAAVNNGGLCGATGWRLPTRMELQSLVDYSKPYPGPTIDTAWFPNTVLGYWTGTAYACCASYAWFVSFYYGGVDILQPNYSLAVRLVRAVQ